jgi:hypothetical protein
MDLILTIKCPYTALPEDASIILQLEELSSTQRKLLWDLLDSIEASPTAPKPNLTSGSETSDTGSIKPSDTPPTSTGQ